MKRGWLFWMNAAALLPSSGLAEDSSRLFLPPAIYAVAGDEVNIYFNAITLAPEGKNFLFDVECAKGKHYRERWAFTPEEAGTLPWKVEVRNLEDQVLATGTTTIRVAKANAGEGRSIRFLAIGDSLTHAGVYTEELRKLFARPGNPKFSLVGTHHQAGTAPENVHEGYGGWKCIDFLEKFEPHPEPGSHSKRSSPFIFNENGRPVFDINRYVRERLAGAPPDFLFLFLGTNDVFAAPLENREAAVEQIAANAERLVKELRAAMPGTKIGISGPVPSANQDAFAENYGSAYTQWGYRKSQHLLAEKLLGKFSGLGREGIYYVPLLANFDPELDYVIKPDVPANARARHTIPRAMNALHPDLPGYQHWADTVYAWIKNLVEEP